jgi:hypothetical protein
MNHSLKRISAFFLLLTSCMPFLFTLFFLVKQQIIRHEMKEKLEKEISHTIVVPKNEVVWVRYQKEISIDAKLFDVKSFSEENGLCFFVGLFDAEESSLTDLLEKETDEKNETQCSQLFKWLQSPCTGLSFEPVRLIDHNKDHNFPILLNISSPFLSIPTPPPQA